MKKIALLIVSVALVLVLSGCTQNKAQTQIEKQEKQIEQLRHEKRELTLLLENEKQKTNVLPVVEESNTNEELTPKEELESLFTSFIHAQFEQNSEALKPLTTAKLYTILVDKAGEYETSIAFQSTVKSIILYQAESLNDTEATLVGKIEIETKVGDFEPNRYEQLVECTALKNTDDKFQVDSQQLTNLSK
ncbi:hypothetical protein D920_00514 [Enterococcus faecalis 13-SD-W-01]|nr:hypothetical protein D920_00514 [Enterococcus faecalis 13-SD-W-01]